ncbi:hypothetical protein [Chondromyces apiculatus]|uniref:Uncharacterized protein n=1 Tax=Chondromyces apiculatus DSM 436 TaxID=1192034 RepID=A0A017T1H1_9BACT|nr:hypothetical protein [Chondromyces apiculatus]EYF03089.1 Hypothetical protein CAP_6203 [Chondromyces apiculatus DSM 436]
MNSCLKSLRSLAIVLGLAVFATGCIAQTGDEMGDADTEMLDDEAGDEDAEAGDEDAEAGDEIADGGDDETPPPPPPSPNGLCTGTTCNQI